MANLWTIDNRHSNKTKIQAFGSVETFAVTSGVKKTKEEASRIAEFLIIESAREREYILWIPDA